MQVLLLLILSIFFIFIFMYFMNSYERELNDKLQMMYENEVCSSYPENIVGTMEECHEETKCIANMVSKNLTRRERSEFLSVIDINDIDKTHVGILRLYSHEKIIRLIKVADDECYYKKLFPERYPVE